MRLKLAFLLPMAQLPLALFLLRWGEHVSAVMQRRYDTLYAPTPALVCAGINAPARLLEATSHFFYRVDHSPPTILGFDLDFVFFLVGIIVLWLLVGWALDKRRSPAEPRSAWSPARFLFVGVPLSLMGALFLYFSVQGFMTPWRFNNQTGNIVHSIFLLLWSLVFLSIPATKVFRRLNVSPPMTPD